MSQLLPSEFSEYEIYCEKWLHPTEARRNTARINSNMEDIQAFYDAVMLRLEEMTIYLNDQPYRELNSQQQNLLDLILAFVEATSAVERFQRPIVTPLFPPERFLIHESTGATGA
ncbi:MAG: hypothetical protein DRQ60_01335 [Gammaproteobacteria bacterium]|nr:MAG: hypothetical protein DRQ52_00155 [Gammaproteobacteria bacterium]RLA17693.1 MAG: hypothetical protein DRQ60_01335 [Gammaproteobacteria bacterium]